MTREEIMNMNDKDKINTAIAKLIYEYDVYQDNYDGDWYIKIPYSDPMLVPNYCEDISMAIELIEYLRKKGWAFTLKIDNIIWAELCGLGLGYFTGVGKTTSEAICKVILLASLEKDIWHEK